MSETGIVCADLKTAIEDWRAKGFRLDVIYPADDPHSAVLSRDGETVRVTTRPDEAAPIGRLPEFTPKFLITRGGEAGEGRAGMLYRDLIPGRLGGRYIASHITIPDGGPVDDWVHFHRIALQMIIVRRGWVRVVYEDQGDPFVLNAGDMVLQPPHIRHRVLESSPGLEVVELSAPALHETFAEHELDLPNARIDRDRLFGGQRFLRHVAEDTTWTPFAGGEAQETAMTEATGGLADVRTIKSDAGTVDFEPHDGELVFGFVVEGHARLEFGDGHDLRPADAFVIPPQEPWRLSGASPDFRLLQVTTSRL